VLILLRLLQWDVNVFRRWNPVGIGGAQLILGEGQIDSDCRQLRLVAVDQVCRSLERFLMGRLMKRARNSIWVMLDMGDSPSICSSTADSNESGRIQGFSSLQAQINGA